MIYGFVPILEKTLIRAMIICVESRVNIDVFLNKSVNYFLAGVTNMSGLYSAAAFNRPISAALRCRYAWTHTRTQPHSLPAWIAMAKVRSV